MNASDKHTVLVANYDARRATEGLEDAVHEGRWQDVRKEAQRMRDDVERIWQVVIENVVP